MAFGRKRKKRRIRGIAYKTITTRRAKLSKGFRIQGRGICQKEEGSRKENKAVADRRQREKAMEAEKQEWDGT